MSQNMSDALPRSGRAVRRAVCLSLIALLGTLAALAAVWMRAGEGVPLRYNKDKREKPVFSMGLSVCRSHFNSFSNIETDAKI